VDEPATAEIVAVNYPKIPKDPENPDSGLVPAFALALPLDVPTFSARMQVADLSQMINPTSDEVLLATVKVRGIAPGTTDLRVVVTRVDDDDGQPVNPPAPPITLTVQ
ncbi:MAG: hypothetical protein J4N64_09305, partial [Chloroflexi bacterium]|nr:hypothetical protein [Chloroflexota bacterium]